MDAKSRIESLAIWAELGRQLRSAQNKAPDWAAVTELIDATQPVLQQNLSEARRLLEQSNRLLAPLKDPFETRLGLHRWLSSEREEAYSDWLAWIIEQLATHDKIIPFLCGVNADDLATVCNGALKVRRETVVIVGGEVRRTDIEIFFAQMPAILIEVKIIEIEGNEAVKLYGHKEYGATFKKCLLLTPSGDLDSRPEGFDLVSWTNICVRLRRLAPTICRENLSVAALILAFVGAVEQNVLQLPSSDRWSRVAPDLLDYLRESVEGGSNDIRPNQA